ncbi:hypothetical protein K501DRAFT_265421 [Backusella circina FSU 941]|nr:hypothetical protein K501DRAFT_265421 [Backusella circina FSU 941]
MAPLSFSLLSLSLPVWPLKPHELNATPLLNVDGDRPNSDAIYTGSVVCLRIVGRCLLGIEDAYLSEVNSNDFECSEEKDIMPYGLSDGMVIKALNKFKNFDFFLAHVQENYGETCNEVSNNLSLKRTTFTFINYCKNFLSEKLFTHTI